MSVVINGSAGVTVNSGAVLGITSGTAVASTSGTSIDFTSIPSWVKRITVMLNGVSFNASATITIQLGDSGGIEATGYASAVAGGSTTSTTAFVLADTQVAASLYHGQVIISLLGSNTWVYSSGVYATSATQANVGAGVKSLSDTLTQVRISSAAGTATFDAGSINILYE
jgi:hypothetical protein